MRLIIALGLLLVVGAPAQEDSIKTKVETVYYPPLAKAARVNGNVKLIREANGNVKVISGPPILEKGAINNLASLSELDGREIQAVYHFTMEEQAEKDLAWKGKACRNETETIVQIGSLDRKSNGFIWTILHPFAKKPPEPYKFTREYSVAPQSSYTRSGEEIVVNVYGCTSQMTSEGRA